MEAMRSAAREHGGPSRVAEQREKGEPTARERIDALLDPGSFEETGGLAGEARWNPETNELLGLSPHAFVGGAGRVGRLRARRRPRDGPRRPRDVARPQAGPPRGPRSEGFDGETPRRRLGSVATILDLGYDYVPPLLGFDREVEMIDEVPVVAALLGPVVGFGASRAACSRFAIAANKTARLFVAGPPVVEGAAGETVGNDDLGGAARHNGLIDAVADSENDVFTAAARAFLSYVPLSARDLPPRAGRPGSRRPGLGRPATPDGAPRRRRDYHPNRRFRVSFFEIGERWGRSRVASELARIGGAPVAVVSNDSRFDAGALTAHAAAKQARLLRLARTFHLPAVNFVDQPGIDVGARAERRGTIRAAVDALAALYDLNSGYFAVIVRRCYGVGGAMQVDAGPEQQRF
ncbi:hypothetical protein CTAYLR_003436 [Chrysophaeum taylorii]|uniref:CoA carboxyltransferase C-terminal domain-containing protein n=1 Tax=Chrysophaeum taylorii TaxID=2483200 RepID=A0AAD7XIM7_9STRA|nr:hypothetical protein CTAYLR_003436 [Chrysophaeum taylorii]